MQVTISGSQIFLLVFALAFVAPLLDSHVIERLFPSGPEGINSARVLITLGVIMVAAVGMFVADAGRERPRG